MKQFSTIRDNMRQIIKLLSSRANILAFGIGLLGLSIAVTPPGVFGVTNYMVETFGLTAPLMGLLMSTGGWAALFLKVNRKWFLALTCQWGMYAIGSFFFALSNGTSSTVPFAYILLYGIILREAWDLP